jgi:hypothetical protein
MEIKKRPSPWPWVTLIVLLLVCCLAAPRFWQPAPTTDLDLLAPISADEFQASVSNARPVQFNTAIGPVIAELGGLFEPPSIEELVASRSIYGQYDSGRYRDSQAFDWSQSANPAANSTGAPESTGIDDLFGPDRAVEPDPFFTASLEMVGELIAVYSPATLVSQLLTQVGDAIPPYLTAWSTVTPIGGPDITSQSSLQFLRPGDRLAMLPAAPRQTPWCVPETLFAQIQRLAEHPYTSSWAGQVINQLHAITEREHLEGDDVQLILSDLSVGAREAVQMADSTDDDRLRVELLRAHWALARRLDCWGAMHEERVAFKAQGRVAARGELSPYFSSAPPASPTPADVAQLTTNLEAYERSRNPILASQIVQQQRALAMSPEPYDRAVADTVEQHYRNANIRVAITAQMVNRMIGEQRNESRPVRDKIAGAFVVGQSDIHSQSNVQLAPANNEWQMRVQTQGVVESNTRANAGPVRLRSQGAIDFAGSKTVVVRPDGVQLQPSDIQTFYRNRLTGVTTDYDWVPFVGGMTRERAVQEYRAKQNWVREAMESRVSSEASDTLDRETHEAMERVRQRVYDRFTNRFDEYGIKLTTIEMTSTPERLVARVRVASNDQLGSHTPRPRALSDSLASVQVHESAMNNLAITLGLDGQRLTGVELQQKLHERFPQIALRTAEEVRRDTVFQFVAKDAVQFRVADGKLELQIGFDSVELDGDAIENVIVHASYIPDVVGLNADLKRDGALGIEGRLSASERARMHNIFKTVFPPERKLQIVQLNADNDPHLQGLMITQLVLEDGWIGLAIGPETAQRVAERYRSLK